MADAHTSLDRAALVRPQRSIGLVDLPDHATWLRPLSSNPKIIRDAVPPRDAVAMLGRLTALPEHKFWPDEPAVTDAAPFTSLALVGHRQVTDAYLLALALHHDGKLATLDRGVPELIAERAERARWVELVKAL